MNVPSNVARNVASNASGAVVTPKPSETRIATAEFLAGATSIEQLPAPAIAEIAFAGRSNVGKSSLLNAMLQRKSLARTSNTPGRTRQINLFGVTCTDGLAVHFVDLPGYGYAKVSKAMKADWGPMMETYLMERQTLRAVVILADLRRGLEEDDIQLLDFVSQERRVQENKPLEVIVVATKVDKLPLSRRKVQLEVFRKTAGRKAIGFSAETGEGRDELWRRLRFAI